MPHLTRPLSNGQSLVYLWFSALHTRVDIMMRSDRSEAEMLATGQNIKQLLQEIEHVGNCFDPTSEIAQINLLQPHQSLQLSEKLADMLRMCISLNERTLGLFDISVESPHHTPTLLHSITLSSDNQLSIGNEPIKLNLSGWLKGFALDKIKPILLESSIHDALVSLGNSSIMALGNGMDDDGWEIRDRIDESEQAVILHDECLTTSGNNTPERKHILSPFTHEYMQGQQEVSVVTTSGSEGEALSTALCLCDESQELRIKTEFDINKIIRKVNKAKV